MASNPPPSGSQAGNGPGTSQQCASDWQEYEASGGRRYYYNKITKYSSWEKPSELLTPLEKADASTVWKEFTTVQGRKYYYNKETKQSRWTIPDELKLAREQAEKSAADRLHPQTDVSSLPPTTSGNSVEQPSTFKPVHVNMYLCNNFNRQLKL